MIPQKENSSKNADDPPASQGERGSEVRGQPPREKTAEGRDPQNRDNIEAHHPAPLVLLHQNLQKGVAGDQKGDHAEPDKPHEQEGEGKPPGGGEKGYAGAEET